MSEILIVGVYLADKPHTAGHLTYEILGSRDHGVTIRWLAVAPGGAGDFGLPGTVVVETKVVEKFSAIDKLTVDAADFDWLIILDDDIELPPGFLDTFVALAERYDFAMCQPARSSNSYIDHAIVMQMPGLAARRTRFVEIGPLLAIRADAMPLILPFGPAAGMGWGLDFVWPVRLEQAGLRMGIIDAAPLAHRLRQPASGYSREKASHAFSACLAAHPHMTPQQAFSVLEAYV